MHTDLYSDLHQTGLAAQLVTPGRWHHQGCCLQVSL